MILNNGCSGGLDAICHLDSGYDQIKSRVISFYQNTVSLGTEYVCEFRSSNTFVKGSSANGSIGVFRIYGINR